MSVRLLALSLVVLSLAAPPVARGEGDEQDIAFEKNLELLHAQMKLRVVGHLLGRGFLVPPSTIEQYQTEQRELLDALGAAEKRDAEVLRAWVEESAKTEEAEDLELQKLIQKTGEHLLTGASEAVRATKEWQLLVNDWQAVDASNELGRARRIEAFLQGARDASPAGRLRADVEKSVKGIYRGAIQRTDGLVKSLVEIRRQRLLLEGSIKVLDAVKAGLDGLALVEAAGDPAEAVRAKAAELLKKQVDLTINQHLSRRGVRVDTETVGKVTDQLMAMGTLAYDTWNQMEEVNRDMTLNPAARAAVKRFTVLGAICSATVGLVEAFAEAPVVGPVVSVMKFYVDAILLIPGIARKVAALVEKMNQGIKGTAAADEYKDVPSELGMFRVTSLGGRFSLPIAYEEKWQEEANAESFVFVVDKEIVPRGYATMSREQYRRLLQIVTDERIVNAPIEAGARRELLDPEERALAGLAKAAGKTPFTPRELVEDLALGTNDLAEKWGTARETAIDVLAWEMAIRSSLGSYQESDYDGWDAYVGVLRESNVPLAPQQILNLFGWYQDHDTGVVAWARRLTDGATRLEEVLGRLRAARIAERRGKMTIGISDLTITPEGAAAGERVEVSARIFVGDLAPGVTRRARVTWTVPGETGPGTETFRMELGNGASDVKLELALPRGLQADGSEVAIEVATVERDGGLSPVTARRSAPLIGGEKADATKEGWHLTRVTVEAKDHEDAKGSVAYGDGKLVLRSERKVCLLMTNPLLEKPVYLYRVGSIHGVARENEWVAAYVPPDEAKNGIRWSHGGSGEYTIIVSGHQGPYRGVGALEADKARLSASGASINDPYVHAKREPDTKDGLRPGIAVFALEGLDAVPDDRKAELRLGASSNEVAHLKGLANTTAFGLAEIGIDLAASGYRAELRENGQMVSPGFEPVEGTTGEPRSASVELRERAEMDPREFKVVVAMTHGGARGEGYLRVTLVYTKAEPERVNLGDGVGEDPASLLDVPMAPAPDPNGEFEEMTFVPMEQAAEAGPPPYVDASELDPPKRAGGPAAEDPLVVLRTEAPWQDSRVKQLIDEWLRISTPYSLTALVPGELKGYHWDEWGTPIGPGITHFDHPKDIDRHQFLWMKARRLTSSRHYTLMEYIERRLQGLPGEHDPRENPNPLAGRLGGGAKPPAAPPKDPTPPKRPPPPEDQPPPPVPATPRVGTAVGDLAPDFVWGGTGKGKRSLSSLDGVVRILVLSPTPSRQAEHMALWVEDRTASCGSGDVESFLVCPLGGGKERRGMWERGEDYDKDGRTVEIEEKAPRKAYRISPNDQDRYEADYGLSADPVLAASPRLLVIDRKGVVRFRRDGDLTSFFEARDDYARFVELMQELLPSTDWPRGGKR